jgi:hypothetical protein
MAALKDRRHEIVAQKLASGANAEAASAALDSDNRPIYNINAKSFASNARKRAQRSDIKARVIEIQSAIAAYTVIDAAWIRGRAARIGGLDVDPEKISASEVIAALGLLAKMTPGALVPTKIAPTGADGDGPGVLEVRWADEKSPAPAAP